jgi:DNA-directed RNA polymerase specialized sigma24 family protein
LPDRHLGANVAAGGSREADPGQDEPGPAARSAGVAARDSYGRLLALLAASTSDLDAAEDALADAFERALRTWPSQGVPGNPGAWLLTVARNRLRDQRSPRGRSGPSPSMPARTHWRIPMTLTSTRSLTGGLN